MAKMRIQFEMEDADWAELCKLLTLEGDTARKQSYSLRRYFYEKILKKPPPLTAQETAEQKRTLERIKKIEEKLDFEKKRLFGTVSKKVTKVTTEDDINNNADEAEFILPPLEVEEFTLPEIDEMN